MSGRCRYRVDIEEIVNMSLPGNGGLPLKVDYFEVSHVCRNCDVACRHGCPIRWRYNRNVGRRSVLTGSSDRYIRGDRRG